MVRRRLGRHRKVKTDQKDSNQLKEWKASDCMVHRTPAAFILSRVCATITFLFGSSDIVWGQVQQRALVEQQQPQQTRFLLTGEQEEKTRPWTQRKTLWGFHGSSSTDFSQHQMCTQVHLLLESISKMMILLKPHTQTSISIVPYAVCIYVMHGPFPKSSSDQYRCWKNGALLKSESE